MVIITKRTNSNNKPLQLPRRTSSSTQRTRRTASSSSLRQQQIADGNGRVKFVRPYCLFFSSALLSFVLYTNYSVLQLSLLSSTTYYLDDDESTTSWLFPHQYQAHPATSAYDGTSNSIKASDDNGSSIRSLQQQQMQQEEDSPFSGTGNVCDWLLHNTNSNPLQIWMENLPQILNASIYEEDDNDPHSRHITAQMLNYVSKGNLLQQSLSMLPRRSQDLSGLLQKLHARIQCVLDPTSATPPPPPVVITVLGGSVAVGVNCFTSVKKITTAKCSWPLRLEYFLNKILYAIISSNTNEIVASRQNEFKLVELHSVVSGGTNTELGKAVLDLDLLKDGAENYDVIINAYGTNDMHALTVNDALEHNITLRDKVFDMCQEFARTVLQRDDNNDNPCHNTKRPILIWLDDYIGNEQREILKTMELIQSLHVLANYYGFGLISYANAVRDVVYADTQESAFSPRGWYNQPKRGNQMLREIHPGQGMHMTVTWMLSYYFLSMISNHCIMEQYNNKDNDNDVLLGSLHDEDEDEPQHYDTDPIFPRNPPDNSLPPPLISNLTLDVISQKWKEEAAATETRRRTAVDCTSSSPQRKKCPVSWVSGMPWRHGTWIINYFRPVLQQPLEWDVIDDTKGKRGKFGWMPITTDNKYVGGAITTKKLRSTLIMNFNVKDHHANEIRQVTYFYVKSYGPKWENSTAIATLERQVVVGTTNTWVRAGEPHQMEGIHEKRTTETYTDTVKLSEPPSNTTALRFRLVHTGGSTFKLIGIALCRG